MNLDNFMNILPFAAGLFYFTFEWFGNKFSVKVSSGITSGIWLFYDVSSFSIPGICTDIISILACLIGVRKDYLKRNKKRR